MKAAFSWGSRCAECGKPMPSGQTQRCEKGGFCSWHIPAAALDSMAEMYEALGEANALYTSYGLLAQDSACGSWIGKVRDALSRIEGRR